MKTALIIFAYAFVAFIVYAVARLFFFDDDDEADMAMAWVFSIFWPFSLPAFLISQIIFWILSIIDRLLFGIWDRIKTKRRDERK